MILLTTSLTKLQECVRAIEDALHEPVVMAGSLQEAVMELQTKEFSVAVFDYLLLDAEPDDGDAAFRNLGGTLPVYVNFAVTGRERLIRDLRLAVQRRNREMLVAKQEAERSLRNELKDQITVLLLSCEMALEALDLPEVAQAKISGVYEVARQLRERLEPEANGTAAD